MTRAGIAEVVITPPVGTCMLEPPGVPTTGVHDDLYCRVLVLEDSYHKIALVTMDLLGMDARLVWRTRHAVLEQAGITAVMLTTTHNHSAPVTLDCGQDDRRDRGWENELVQKIAACVAQAAKNLKPVTLAFGRAAVQIGVNRRISVMGRTRMLTNGHAPVIPHVDVLRIDKTDGDVMAVLFSHAAHPVTVHTSSTEFNADYPGYAVRQLRESLGVDVMPMFAQGCAGDINVTSLAGGLAEAERLGRLLGDAAAQAVHVAEPFAVERIHIADRETMLPFEPIASETIDALAARIQESAQALPDHDDDPRMQHDQAMLVRWTERVRKAPPGLRFRAQGIAFDDQLVLLGMTHELFAAYQIAIQTRSPFQRTMVFSYTNGCNGYIPTAAAYYLGGYEVDGAPKLFGLPRLQPDCEALVHATVDDLLTELYEVT